MIPDPQTVFSLGNPTSSSFDLGATISGLDFNFYMGSVLVLTGQLSSSLNAWTHIAVSHYQDKLHLFQDGVLRTELARDFGVRVTDNIDPLLIGVGTHPEIDDHFHGYITNFHFVRGIGLYDEGSNVLGQKCFNRPIAPIKRRGESRLLLWARNPCDVLYDPTINPGIHMINHGVSYSTDYPRFKRIKIPVVDYHFNTFFGLGQESIQVSQSAFTYGDIIVMDATQKKYSFDYYEIHSPVTIVRSDEYYITYLNYTASFDPKTEVCLTTNEELSGSSSPIIAHYR